MNYLFLSLLDGMAKQEPMIGQEEIGGTGIFLQAKNKPCILHLVDDLILNTWQDISLGGWFLQLCCLNSRDQLQRLCGLISLWQLWISTLSRTPTRALLQDVPWNLQLWGRVIKNRHFIFLLYRCWLIIRPASDFTSNRRRFNPVNSLIGKVAADQSHKWVYKEPNEQEINFLSAWHNSADSVSISLILAYTGS